MAMHVDESGCESKPVFVPNCFARLWNQSFRNGRNAVTFDTHVRLEWLFRGAIVNHNVLENRIGAIDVFRYDKQQTKY